MAKYEYEVTETKHVDVPDCPLCGYRSGLDDLKRKFFNIMDKFKENAAKC